MSAQDLLRYWPTDKEVNDCIKSEAEASSEAVALAVHQPMRFERRVIGTSTGSSAELCDEQELLRAFLSKHLPEGRVILPITGSSGVGKSHVVRWLEVAIRRSPDLDQRVVIRIPKGTSLRGVLGILLEQLQDPVYDRYRRELSRAQQELEPHEAAGLLCEMLAHAIEEMGEQAQARLVENPASTDARERATYCRRDMLPTLLRNQVLRDHHFVRTFDGGEGVVRRLVEHLTEGRPAGDADDRQHLFMPDDLAFDFRIARSALGRAEVAALAKIDRDDRRPVAARILNAALDDAKQSLLRLDPTVSDLFEAVRRELLHQGRELVLLVEDFAVLSGLQKQLLQVMIKEAVRDGGPVLCTMRTALAYTTGYLDTATVLTRANIEYRIPDEPGSEEQILDRVEQLVGAYLNAARLGRARLEQAYAARRPATRDPRDWIPRFEMNVEPEIRATLTAFGLSADHYELFPFNGAAIRQLAREFCQQNGRLVYNPRYVIQNVITKVLELRDLFERGVFPPTRFGQTQLPARVVEDVRRSVSPAQLDRYLRFLTYWSGPLDSIADIRNVEPRVFEAFGLNKKPLESAVGAPPKPQANGAAKAPPKEKPSAKDSIEARWDQLFEQWRRGRSDLPQAEANQLRKWIVDSLRAAIDWDWELFRPRKESGVEAWHQLVFIPRAPGNEGRTADQAMVSLCTEEDLQDEVSSARIQSALMAIVRFHAIYKGDWDYDGAAEDLPRFTAFLEPLVPRARAFVRARYFRTAWDPLPSLVHGLLIGARALGLDKADKDVDPTALVNALFLPASSAEAPAAEGDPTEGVSLTNWELFTKALATCRRSDADLAADQASWSTRLLDLVGARQGGADKVHAVDVLQLKPAIEETIHHWQFTAQFPSSAPAGVPEFGPLKRTYSELAKSATAITEQQKWLYAWRRRMEDWLGRDSDKDELVRQLKDIAETAKAAGVARDIDTRGLLRLVEAFRLAKVKAALDDTAELDESLPRGKVLAVLGRGYSPVARLCDNLHERFDDFARAVEADLQGEKVRLGTDPVAEAVTELRAALHEVELLLQAIRA